MKQLQGDASDGTPADTGSAIERRAAILGRLEEINGPAVPSGYSSSVVKSDVHWDHVMQEMVS